MIYTLQCILLLYEVTYKWLKFPLANEIKFTNKVVEVLVAGVNMRFLHNIAINSFSTHVDLMFH